MRALITPFLASLLIASPAFAASHAELSVTVEDIADHAPIPMKYALCEATPEGKSTDGENLRPTISWSSAPEGTKSFAVVVTDPFVPADFSKAGKDGKVVKATDKRQVFYHWALADIPATATSIPGSPSDKAPDFGTKATNSLGSYMKDATNYGGPCPPWNDEAVHEYTFTVYAVDTEKLLLPTNPTAKDVQKAAASHAIANGAVTGTYTLNPALMK